MSTRFRFFSGCVFEYNFQTFSTQTSDKYRFAVVGCLFWVMARYCHVKNGYVKHFQICHRHAYNFLFTISMENWTSSTMTTRERKETEWENARCIVTNDVEFVVKSQWMRYIRSKKHENWLKTIVIPLFLNSVNYLRKSRIVENDGVPSDFQRSFRLVQYVTLPIHDCWHAWIRHRNSDVIEWFVVCREVSDRN